LIRNRISFAISYRITPRINDIGQRNTFIMVAVLALVCNGTMFVAIWWVKKLRQRSAEILGVCGGGEGEGVESLIGGQRKS
jgi:hypothetical protein